VGRTKAGRSGGTPNAADQARAAEFVRVRRVWGLDVKNVDVDLLRQALALFTGLAGSRPASLAFGTRHAALRRSGSADQRTISRRDREPALLATTSYPSAGGRTGAARHTGGRR
jgi:hypothetical protein